MRLHEAHRVVFALALGCAGPVGAAPPQSGQDQAIIVNGVRQAPADPRKQAVDFVAAMGVATDQQPAARWVVPVCLRALGLADQYTAIVEAKMRAIALDAHVPLANQPCRTNVAVQFALDGGAVVRDLLKRAPDRLGNLRGAEKTALADRAVPVRWWYNSGRRTKDGTRGTDIPAGLVGGALGSGQTIVPVSNDSESFQQFGSSIIGTRIIRELTQATVIVDLTRASGVTLDAVAAYAALVAFAEIKPGVAPDASILGVFDATERLRDLSPADRAFLRALYRLPLDREARAQRGLMIRDVADAGKIADRP